MPSRVVTLFAVSLVDNGARLTAWCGRALAFAPLVRDCGSVVAASRSPLAIMRPKMKRVNAVIETLTIASTETPPKRVDVDLPARQRVFFRCMRFRGFDWRSSSNQY